MHVYIKVNYKLTEILGSNNDDVRHILTLIHISIRVDSIDSEFYPIFGP